MIQHVIQNRDSRLCSKGLDLETSPDHVISKNPAPAAHPEKTSMKFLTIDTSLSEVKTEFIAGMSTFLAMLYIVPVNAAIMSQAGMPFDALVTATALMTIIATTGNGLWADTPVAMSVGMGLNAYFTFGLVKGQGIPWQTGLGIVFLSGILYILISITPLRRWMIETIPLDIKRAVSAGIGAFIAFIGLKEMGLIVKSDATFVTLGDLHNPQVLLGILSLVLAVIFMVRRIKAAFILAILITTITAWFTGAADLPGSFLSMPAPVTPIALKMDVSSALSLSLFPVLLTFLVTDIFDTMGTLTGVGLRANLFQEGHSIPLQKTIEADAAATLLSAIMGVTSTTSFIESAAGVEAGGRKGLTAVFTGLLFIFPLFMLPFFKAIPDAAIYPVLVVVGALMFSEISHIDFSDMPTTLAAFFMVMMMPLSYSITNGLMIGSLVFVAAHLALGTPQNIGKAVWIFAATGVLLLFIL